jgi:hypothetical protein
MATGSRTKNRESRAERARDPGEDRQGAVELFVSTGYLQTTTADIARAAATSASGSPPSVRWSRSSAASRAMPGGSRSTERPRWSTRSNRRKPTGCSSSNGDGQPRTGRPGSNATWPPNSFPETLATLASRADTRSAAKCGGSRDNLSRPASPRDDSVVRNAHRPVAVPGAPRPHFPGPLVARILGRVGTGGDCGRLPARGETPSRSA